MLQEKILQATYLHMKNLLSLMEFETDSDRLSDHCAFQQVRFKPIILWAGFSGCFPVRDSKDMGSFKCLIPL